MSNAVLTSADFDFSKNEIKSYVKLTLRKGDVVGVTKDNIAGWSIGKIGDRIGLFPASFASPVKCAEEQAGKIVLKIWRSYKFKKGLLGKNRVREIMCIVNELVDTEKSYLYFLEILDTLYIQMFEQRIEAKKPIISQDEIKKLFGNVRQIRNLTKILLNEIQKQKDEITNSGNIPKILDVFVRHLPFLNFYSDYVKGYDMAVEITNDLCKKNKEFEKILKQFRDDPRSKGLGLRDLLPKPMQRIFGYKNLFDRLVKITPSESVIYCKVKSLGDNMEKIVSRINESKRHFETTQKVASQLGKLLISWRKFMKEGRIRIVNEKGEEWADCYLASDIFAYTTGKKDIAYFPLVFTTLSDNGETSLILLTLNEPPLMLRFSDVSEKNEWFNLTRRNIEEEKALNAKKYNITNPIDEASRWVQSIGEFEQKNKAIDMLIAEYSVHKASLKEYESSINSYKSEIRDLIENIKKIHEERKKLDNTLEESKNIQELVNEQESLLSTVEKQREMFLSLCTDESSFRKLFGTSDTKFQAEKGNFDQVRNQRNSFDSQNSNYLTSNVIIDAKTQESIEQLKREYGEEFSLIHNVIQQLDHQEINYEMVYQKQEYENRNKFLEERNRTLEENNQKLNRKVTKLYEKIKLLESSMTETLQKNSFDKFSIEIKSLFEQNDEINVKKIETACERIGASEIDSKYEETIKKKDAEIEELKKIISDFNNARNDDEVIEDVNELSSRNAKLMNEIKLVTTTLGNVREEKINERKHISKQLEELSITYKSQIQYYISTNKMLLNQISTSQQAVTDMQLELANMFEKLERNFIRNSDSSQTIDELRQQLEKSKQDNMKLQFSLAHSITKEMKCQKLLEEEKQKLIQSEQKLSQSDQELNALRRKSFRLPTTETLPSRFSIRELPETPITTQVFQRVEPKELPQRPVSMVIPESASNDIQEEIEDYVDPTSSDKPRASPMRSSISNEDPRRRTISFLNPLLGMNSKQDTNLIDEMKNRFSLKKK
ncbi:rhoGEF domain-containing protein [Naegleria gruberi]|uniref:RhoGEF domain-containing protein n=1 Tax=Naegleria gruberi TaxID=5762 RepID=D2VEP1_NAEGR|nr:rhoGEF domain-containing protein [Naegleria gruberi]EFC44538.1 rhoGEF domain-containing protein [Naegleria gruberi]|eukprot:XP_002677282.1 rhoGEF domain-containing protein [Naegleria gruberi strain NEG-M]